MTQIEDKIKKVFHPNFQYIEVPHARNVVVIEANGTRYNGMPINMSREIKTLIEEVVKTIIFKSNLLSFDEIMEENVVQDNEFYRQGWKDKEQKIKEEAREMGLNIE